MTESEWLACEDPQQMLEYLRGKGSDRKLRLFACGYCRHIGYLAMDEICRQAVDVAERHADEEVLIGDLELVWEAVAELQDRQTGIVTPWERWWSPVYYATSPVVLDSGNSHDHSAAWGAAQSVAVGISDPISRPSTRSGVRKVQVALVRCLFGNLFRFPVIDRRALYWNDRAVPKIAKTIYEDRAFDRLPILADALEDAGCDNADILAHCRGPGPHVRGCWVVDLLLGKS